MYIKKNQNFGILILIVTAMIWGGSFVSQLLGAQMLPPFTFCGARMTIAAMALGSVVAIIKLTEKRCRPKEVVTSEYKKNTLVGGFACGICLTGALLSQQTGAIYVTAGKAGFLCALYIIVIPIATHFLLKQRATLTIWLAVAFAVGGLYLLCGGDLSGFSKGDLLMFCSAFFYGLHIMVCNHFVERGDALIISCLQFAVFAVLAWLGAFIFESPSVTQMASAVGPLLYCGILSGGVGYTLQMIGQQFVEPVKCSLILSTESCFAVLFGMVFLGERMSIAELCGCALMMAALVIVQLQKTGR